jgi:predicted alpha/beta-fold hydrolase
MAVDTSDVEPFEPARWAPGGDLQTVVGYFLPSPRSVPREQRFVVELDDGDRLLVVENAPRVVPEVPKVALVIHGLGGDVTSPYMRRLAKRFTAEGYVCARMNMRGAGAGRALATGMYNAGRSGDLAAVVRALCERHPSSRLVIVGCSISGNVLLKYLGEPEHEKPDALIGSIAICPPVDLAECATHLSGWRNSLYGLKFVTLLRLDARQHPGLPVDPRSLDLLRPMTLLEFDDLATAPSGGFSSGQDYYARCSAVSFVDKIDTDTLILAADDDPFIPVRGYHRLRLSDRVRLVLTRGGGHMGFLCRRETPMRDHRWLDYAAIEYANAFNSRRA